MQVRAVSGGSPLGPASPSRSTRPLVASPRPGCPVVVLLRSVFQLYQLRMLRNVRNGSACRPLSWSSPTVMFCTDFPRPSICTRIIKAPPSLFSSRPPAAAPLRDDSTRRIFFANGVASMSSRTLPDTLSTLPLPGYAPFPAGNQPTTRHHFFPGMKLNHHPASPVPYARRSRAVSSPDGHQCGHHLTRSPEAIRRSPSSRSDQVIPDGGQLMQ